VNKRGLNELNVRARLSLPCSPDEEGCPRNWWDFMGSVCLGDLVNLNTSINKGAVWMYNTFTVIANRMGCTNGMSMK
jgi:hypothetical protein